MNKRMPLAIVVLFLFSFAVVQVTSAQTPVAGVSKGGVFYYDVIVSLNSTDLNATVLSPYSFLQSLEWLRVDVTDVNGSIIYMENTHHFKNGTEVHENCYDNVGNDFDFSGSIGESFFLSPT
jgi:hypothetical protein